MSLASLIATGTKVWLDGVEPDEIERNRDWACGAPDFESESGIFQLVF